MTTRLERVTEEYKEKFPHMKQYAACQSKAFMTGCFTFVAGGAMVYLTQELLRTKLPYQRQYFLLLPIAVGTISAYLITRRNTRICQDMWLAMEEKHSDVTPLHDRLLAGKQSSTKN
ncbi:transmembrane protein 141-like isoform X3 [Littorina saxatilis]|uniref:transmembrane protein 141-like isoform X3 n=1 Tax=Littorina saxatilis TaxID=31220 RepID=UPI0038B58B47